MKFNPYQMTRDHPSRSNGWQLLPVGSSVRLNHPASPGANVGEQLGDLGSVYPLANHSSWREMSGGEAEQQSRVAKTSHPAMPYRTSKIL